MEEENDFIAGVMKIALGIFFGGLLIWMAIELRARYELNQLNKAAIAATEELTRQTQIIRDQSLQRQRQQEALRSKQEMQRNEQVARAAKAREFQAAQIAAERAKEKAWAVFYRPSDKCLNTASVDCGNAHIKARKEFERRYAAGEL
jgi:uncharacterized iron-regulated membrane protein